MSVDNKEFEKTRAIIAAILIAGEKDFELPEFSNLNDVRA